MGMAASSSNSDLAMFAGYLSERRGHAHSEHDLGVARQVSRYMRVSQEPPEMAFGCIGRSALTSDTSPHGANRIRTRRSPACGSYGFTRSGADRHTQLDV